MMQKRLHNLKQKYSKSVDCTSMGMPRCTRCSGAFFFIGMEKIRQQGINENIDAVAAGTTNAPPYYKTWADSPGPTRVLEFLKMREIRRPLPETRPKQAKTGGVI